MYIYKITNKLNNKIYIGKTTRLQRRYNTYKTAHIWSQKPNIEIKQKITRAIIKYGFENFKFEIIVECNDKNQLNKLEKEYIKQYNSTDSEIGYNISKGGDGGDTLSAHPNKLAIYRKISKSVSGKNNGIHTLKKDPIRFEEWRLKNKLANSGAANANAIKTLQICNDTGTIINIFGCNKEVQSHLNCCYSRMMKIINEKLIINNCYYVREKDYKKV